jgi:hypothetical protein
MREKHLKDILEASSRPGSTDGPSMPESWRDAELLAEVMSRLTQEKPDRLPENWHPALRWFPDLIFRDGRWVRSSQEPPQSD